MTKRELSCEQRKRGVRMYDVIKRLKGISCILYALSNEADITVYDDKAAALDFLSESLKGCVEELEQKAEA